MEARVAGEGGARGRASLEDSSDEIGGGRALPLPLPFVACGRHATPRTGFLNSSFRFSSCSGKSSSNGLRSTSSLARRGSGAEERVLERVAREKEGPARGREGFTSSSSSSASEGERNKAEAFDEARPYLPPMWARKMARGACCWRMRSAASNSCSCSCFSADAACSCSCSGFGGSPLRRRSAASNASRFRYLTCSSSLFSSEEDDEDEEAALLPPRPSTRRFGPNSPILAWVARASAAVKVERRAEVEVVRFLREREKGGQRREGRQDGEGERETEPFGGGFGRFWIPVARATSFHQLINTPYEASTDQTHATKLLPSPPKL